MVRSTDVASDGDCYGCLSLTDEVKLDWLYFSTWGSVLLLLLCLQMTKRNSSGLLAVEACMAWQITPFGSVIGLLQLIDRLMSMSYKDIGRVWSSCRSNRGEEKPKIFVLSTRSSSRQEIYICRYLLLGRYTEIRNGDQQFVMQTDILNLTVR